MAALWKLMGLLLFCSLCMSQECNRAILENIDFPGTDIAQVFSPDVEHCQHMCTQHPSCLFFTFIRPDWTRDKRHFYCYLKSTSTGRPATQTTLWGVSSGFSLASCNPEPQPCLSQVYHNVDFEMPEFQSFFTADYERCQRACTDFKRCQFFTFATEAFEKETFRYKCLLKASWTIPRTPIVEAKAGVTSGFSHKIQMTPKFDTVCSNKLFESTIIPGNDIHVMPAASPEHCLALCSAHPRCSFFSFFSENFSCHLKNNIVEMATVEKEGVTSGLPARYCQLNESWIKKPFKGVDFRGSDIRYELMDDADTCQKTCTEDPSCQFYTYVDKNFHDSDYWRRCYLKRVITLPAPPKVSKLANVVSGFSKRNCV